MRRNLLTAVFMIFLGGIVSGLFAQEKINFEFKGDAFDKWRPESLIQKRDASATDWYEPEIITVYSLNGDVFRLVNSYDSRGYLINSAKQTEFMGGWYDSEITQYSYSGDLLTGFVKSSLQGGNMIDYQRGGYYYNIGNHLIESYVENWSDNLAIWRPQFIRNYEYESDYTDKIVVEMFTQYDYFGAEEYIAIFKYDYQYDAQNRISEKTWRQKMEDNWGNRTNYLYQYHENGKIESIVEQEWDITTWWNKFRRFIVYDDRNRKELEYQETWYGMEWAPALAWDYTYNNAGQLASKSDKTWYANDWLNVSKEEYSYQNNDITVCETYVWFVSRWVEETRFEYEYDAQHNASKGLAFRYVKDEWEAADLTILMRYNGRQSSYNYENSYKVEASYKEAQKPLNRIDDDVENSISVYPNPTTGELSVKSEKLKIKNIQVFDMAGRLLQTTENIDSAEFHIDLTNLSSGIYFVNINGKTVKIAKQ